MKITFPKYYKDFKCIADKCPDTCCDTWGIGIDKKSFHKYMKLKGPFGNRLKNSIDRKDKMFLQSKGRCAFLDENNLCDIYKELGPEGFCHTCRTYPRHVEEFENEREISLSISCPVVADLLINKKDKVDFISKDVDKNENYPSFDYFLYDKLQDTRKVMLNILQDREADIKLRLAMVVSLGHDVQNRIDENKIFDIDQLLLKYEKEGQVQFKQFYLKLVNKKLNSKTENNNWEIIILDALDKLEVLKENWKDLLQNKRMEIEKNQERKQMIISKREEIILEQLAVYFLFTYFCGAVYDERVFDKIKVIVICILSIYMLALNEDGQRDIEKYINISYRFSREVEHSDMNLTILEELVEKYTVKDIILLFWEASDNEDKM